MFFFSALRAQPAQAQAEATQTAQAAYATCVSARATEAAADATVAWYISQPTPTPSATPTPFTDLAVNAVLVSPPRPVVSGTTEIEVGVVNVGNVAVTESFDVEIYQLVGGGAYNTVAYEWKPGVAVGQAVRFNTSYDVVNTERIQVRHTYSDDNHLNDRALVDMLGVTPVPTPLAFAIYEYYEDSAGNVTRFVRERTVGEDNIVRMTLITAAPTAFFTTVAFGIFYYVLVPWYRRRE